MGHRNTVARFQARIRRRHQFRVGHGDYAHFPGGQQLQTGVNRRDPPIRSFPPLYRSLYPPVSRSKATTTTIIVVCIAISIIVAVVDNIAGVRPNRVVATALFIFHFFYVSVESHF